jgi:PAS domain S-box-containing protein
MITSEPLQQSASEKPSGVPAPAGRRLRSSHLSWLPIPLILAAILVLRALDLRQPHESVWLAVLFNLVCSVLVSLWVAYLLARSFVVRPTPGLLMLDLGLVAWGAAGAVGSALLAHSANTSVTAHNSLACLAACFQASGAILMDRPQRTVSGARLWLATGYICVVALIGLIVVAAVDGWMPVFFVEGQGGTPLRQLTLTASVAMYVMAAWLLRRSGKASATPFIHWYSLALGLYAVGLLGVMLEPSVGSDISWAGRSAQFLGGIYVFIAGVASVRETRAWQIPLDRALQRQRDLARESEKRYRGLFETMSEGFALHEIITDDQGRPCDYLFLDVNPAFERYTGLKRSALVGKRVLEVLPGTEAHWIDRYGRVALTGEPLHMENYARELGRWYEVHCYRTAPRRFAVVFTDITRRKQMEAQLRDVAEKYSTLFNATSDGICINSLDGTILETNDAYCQMSGYSRQELIGMPISRLEAAETPEEIAKHTKRVLESGGHDKFESRHRRKDGSIMDVDITAVYFERDGGRTAMFVRNITARKRTEEALRESEGRFRALAEALPQLVWTADPTGAIEWFNRRWYEYTGAPQGTGEGWSWDRVTHPDDMEHTLKNWRKGLETGALFQNEIRVRRHDGEYRWFLVRAWPLRDADGKIARWFGANTDVHDLKVAEAALRQSREDLSRAQEVGQIGSWRLDVGKNVLTWSDENHRIFGVPSGTPLTYEKFLDIVHPDDREYVDTRWKAGLGGEPYDIEHRIVVGGDVKWVREKAYLEFDEVGRLLGGFGITQDITQLKQAETDLRRANEQLEQKVQERTAELARRAEQLRALAGELTLSEQRERRRLAKMLHDHIQQLLVGAKFRTAILGRSGDDLTRQAAAEIEHLLDESIKSSRSLTAELSPPILHEGGLAAGLEWLARWMADRHGLLVDLCMEGELPLLAEDIKVLVFESIRELLFNAVKHAQVASVSVNVRQIGDQELRVTVSDDGPGFDPAPVGRIDAGGGRFGLFTIRERLDFIGGHMEIDSAPGKGSRFTLTAPIRSAQPQPPAIHTFPLDEAASHQVRVVSSRPAAPIRVLLADDHVIMRQGLARLLKEELGIQVVGEAADGEAAVELAARLLPDVILMDMSMPKLNGVEATRAIRNEHPDIRIIGLSMFEEAERARAMRDAGAVAYLTKSGPSSDLVATIRSCMDNQPSPRPPRRGAARKRSPKKAR